MNHLTMIKLQSYPLKVVLQLLILLVLCNTRGKAQLDIDSLPPPQTFDTLALEYYFGFASAWDDTSFYTNVFSRIQDTLAKKDNLERDWDRYVRTQLKYHDHTGFLMGPFYDSSFAVDNIIRWLDEVPDTIPTRAINYTLERDIPDWWQPHDDDNDDDQGEDENDQGQNEHGNTNDDDEQ